MRESILLHEGWIYHADDASLGYALQDMRRYIEAKTECKLRGPASRNYTEGLTWQSVQLPHDYVITQAPQQGNDWEEGHFRYHNAWYRRHFALAAEEAGRRISLYFEGVATHAYVYVNGCLAARNFCGYAPFEVDITSFVLYGQDNVIAVYVDSTSSFEGWWYQGGGIYRNVWLVKGDPLHIARDGVFIHPEYLDAERWRVPVEVEVCNDDLAERKVRVVCRGLCPEGREHFQVQADVTVPALSKRTVQLAADVCAPRRWDIDAPVLYSVETCLMDDGVVLDQQVDRYGYRTFCFAKEGFSLNGRQVYIQGVCCHHDNGLTGKVMPPRIAKYRAKLLKEMGANAVRCSHYPYSRELMDSFDETGFIVMAETRWFSTEPEAMRQLETLIRRDRNRPCVMLWSTGNEEPLQAEDRGVRITRRMAARIRQLDPTRPVTSVVCNDPVNAPVHAYSDVAAFNYSLPAYDDFHQRWPEKPFLAGEICATGTTRGWYADNMPQIARCSAYDHDSSFDFWARERAWKHLKARPWVLGGFQWDAIEHRGEALWPRLCSVAGAIDLFLQKKDAFYQNQSFWREEPMIHLLPHWNHRGSEGRMIDVWAYTNCEEAELFLNGESLGRCGLSPYDHAAWQVPYVSGKLEAIGYRGGVPVCRDVQETTGAPVALKLQIDTAGEVADGQDIALLTCTCVDAQGREVPDAAPVIRFSVNSLGELTGTGSDNCDAVPMPSAERRMYAGRCAVCVRVGKASGTLTVTARAEGLTPAFADIALCAVPESFNA